MDKKELKLTFVEAAFHEGGRKHCYTVLDVYCSADCLQCHKESGPDAMLFLERVPSGKSHVLKAEAYCHTCGNELLVHFSRVRECLVEGGENRLGPCLDKKQKEEEHGQEDEEA